MTLSIMELLATISITVSTARYAECQIFYCHAECQYSEHRFFYMVSVTMLSVTMLSVVMLSVILLSVSFTCRSTKSSALVTRLPPVTGIQLNLSKRLTDWTQEREKNETKKKNRPNFPLSKQKLVHAKKWFHACRKKILAHATHISPSLSLSFTKTHSLTH
jgi:hypothetical protein